MTREADVIQTAHIITDLKVAGAQTVLSQLVERLDRSRYRGTVISLSGEVPLRSKIEAAGWDVVPLGMSPRRPAPVRFLRLVVLLRRLQPDVVQTWLYHGDLVGGLAARAAGIEGLVWGIHLTDMPGGEAPVSTRLVARLNARLSRRLPRTIVACSRTSAETHLRRGYPPEAVMVIPNGFAVPDVDRAEASEWLRAELGIHPDASVVGRMARFAPQKDHRTLLVAMGALAQHDVHLVLCGRDVNPDNPRLTRWVDEAGIASRCHLLGLRDDTDAIIAGCDVTVSSSSWGEALPLVIGESMAAGVPVVTTDVGDSATLVGETGRVVAPRDPDALAGAVDELLRLAPSERDRLGQAARKRIEEHYTLDRMVRLYGEVYEDVASTVSG